MLNGEAGTVAAPVGLSFNIEHSTFHIQHLIFDFGHTADCFPVKFHPAIFRTGAIVPPKWLYQVATRRRSRVRPSMCENASTIDCVQRRFGRRATTSPSLIRNVPSRVVPVISAVFGSSRPLT